MSASRELEIPDHCWRDRDEMKFTQVDNVRAGNNVKI